jgi:excinuclease ABC subunit A
MKGFLTMLQPDDASVHEYYTQQSAITDPRAYATLYEVLPSDIAELCAVIQGCVMHLNMTDHFGLQLSEEQRQEILLRTIPQRLERIVELDASPLTTARPPEKRVIGLCRDYGVMLTSMLRHQGRPARERVGFAAYFRCWERHGYRCDHRITEYWNAEQSRWILVDPQIDDVQRKQLPSEMDVLDLRTDTEFHLAGEVWLRCRAGEVDPNEYGDSPTDRGMAPIRYALLHDFDALNKVELVGMDAWHELIDKPEELVTEEEKRLLDEIAAVTLHVDTRFHDLRNLYNATTYGQAVQHQLRLQVVVEPPFYTAIRT